MKRLLFILVICLAGRMARAETEVSAAERYKIDVEFRRWQPSLDAQIQKSTDDAEGTLIDVTDDLGVEDHGTWDLRGTIQFSQGHKIRVGWTGLDYDGDTEVEEEIRFGGTVYPAGARVVSSIKGNYYTAVYEWDVARGTWGYFGPVFGVKAFDGDTVIVAPEIGDRRIESLHVPIPVLGVVTRLYLGRLSGMAEFSGLTIGERGHIWELEFGGRFDLLGSHLSVEAGYRLLKMHGMQDQDLLDFKLSGLHLGAGVRF